mgnify:CR=1 FL=1
MTLIYWKNRWIKKVFIYLIRCIKVRSEGYVKAMKCVKNQTTAFDTDKVMKQLEDHLFEKYCIEDDPEIAKIVEGGGVE